MRMIRTMLATGCMVCLATPLLAAPTPEDIAKSYANSMEGNIDGAMFLYIVGGLIAVVVVISLINRKWRTAAPGKKSLNHQGKLMREVLKALPLKGREVKQLKALADMTESEKPLASPLTLLLCPSVLAKTIQAKKPRGDRKALINVARKAGLKVTVQ